RQSVDELLEKIFHVQILPRTFRSARFAGREPPEGRVTAAVRTTEPWHSWAQKSKFFKVMTAPRGADHCLSPGHRRRVCIALARAYARGHAVRARTAVVSSLRRSAGRSGIRFRSRRDHRLALRAARLDHPGAS